MTSADLLILRWLAGRDYSAPPAIGTGCSMAPGEVRARLVSLESRRLVASGFERQSVPPRRVYHVTREGRRAVGLLDVVGSVDH